MSTRSGRIRTSVINVSPSKTRKGVSPTRSPARTRKSSPPRQQTPPPASRSPGRKSPARKSPSRKPVSKFPARKSPSRTTKEKEKTEPEIKIPKSPSKRPPIDSEVVIKLESLSANLAALRSTRSKRFEYSIKDLTANLKESEFSLDHVNGLDSIDEYGLRNRRSADELLPRRSSRLREFIDNVPDIRRSISKSVSHSKSISKSASKSLEAYSDEENSEEEFQRERSNLITRKLATPLRSSITEIASKWEFGGRLGSACLMLLIPLTVFFILVLYRESFSLKLFTDWSAYKSLQSYISLQALCIILTQYLLQAILVIVPILGKKSDCMDGSGRKQCFNAFFSCICTIIVLFAMDNLQVIDKESILNDYLRLAVVSYIFAVTLTIIAYEKSHKLDTHELNQYGNTGYALYDFFIGREVHPIVKNIDIKLWISRTANINALILLSMIFAQGLQFKLNRETDLILGSNNFTVENFKLLMNNVQFKPTIMVFSIMQIVYILNFIMKEYMITTTFFWQYEGVGYLQIVSSALYPFYFTTISKHVADTALMLSTNILISACVLFSLGFLIMLNSNDIKYQFRKNPLHPSLARLDTMATFHGNRLLVSSLWGILRHPNYTGDILIHIVFALPGIMSGHYIAALPAILTIVMLMHRAWRDHSRCQRRYGSAWQRYCKRVPSVLLPKLL